jgi:3-oxoacyl-[acyl-carrier protein] reductase
MSDAYAQIVNAPVLGRLAKGAGLPRPVRLERYTPVASRHGGTIVLAAVEGGRLVGPVAGVMRDLGVAVATAAEGSARRAAEHAGLSPAAFDPHAQGEGPVQALVFDASAIADSTELVALQRFFHPAVARLGRCGRVIVLGTPPETIRAARERTAQRALEGFMRALGKEVGGRGATVQLLYAGHGAESELDSTVRFLLSARAAYVSGQVIRLLPPPAPGGQGRPSIDWDAPLAGRTALVTGAARGIGSAIAEVLARDGARVVGLDLASAGAELTALMRRLGGQPLELDITAPEAPAAIASHFDGGLDVLVHNAGVTRDRTLAKMPEERWTTLMEINLSSIERIDDRLLDQGKLRADGRVVCISSIAGIAGNAGQTNYSTSKAGVIGHVEALAPIVAATHGATINAVAPGFIETEMTAAMPLALREAGRRMNSLAQGGVPRDVAEAVAWLASPGSAAVNGNVVRVCGQSLVGG